MALSLHRGGGALPNAKGRSLSIASFVCLPARLFQLSYMKTTVAAPLLGPDVVQVC